MTWSAPSERTRSTLRVLHTPVTSAPKCLAICTANVPTPPDAPLISTFCPGWICPLSRRPCSAVSAATGTAAACSNVKLAGFGATMKDWNLLLRGAATRTHTYSAKAPLLLPPNTSSPGRNCVTSLPTASTVPAKSTPNLLVFGLRSPTCMRATYGVPVREYHSPRFTEAARTRTSTPSSAKSGFSTSWSSRTSGDPYVLRTIAFMVPLLHWPSTPVLLSPAELPRSRAFPNHALSSASHAERLDRPPGRSKACCRFFQRDGQPPNQSVHRRSRWPLILI